MIRLQLIRDAITQLVDTVFFLDRYDTAMATYSYLFDFCHRYAFCYTFFVSTDRISGKWPNVRTWSPSLSSYLSFHRVYFYSTYRHVLNHRATVGLSTRSQRDIQCGRSTYHIACQEGELSGRVLKRLCRTILKYGRASENRMSGNL